MTINKHIFRYLASIHTEYDSLGRLCQKELPNDVTTTYDYNSLGRLTAMSHIKEGFTEAYTYEYDAAGNRLKTIKTSVRDGISDRNIYEYGYDELYHLTEVKRNGDILRRYGYDSYGNRIRKEDFENGGQTTAYTYNANNQLVTGMTGELEEVYGYDRRGNLTSVTSGGNLIKSYRFDYANRMTLATEHGEDSTRRAEYVYNGMGHRISQSLYVTDPEKVINEMLTKEISYTVDMTKKYNNLLNMQESIYSSESYYTAEDIKQAQTSKNFYWDRTVISMEEDEMESYFILDELGSPIELMDEAGFIRESYSYDEFGQATIHKTGNNLADITTPQASSSLETTPLQPFGFTGYQMDEAGGLYYAQARRYDAVNGRFVSKDSDKYVNKTHPRSWNQYIYCDNNPEKYIDPSGNVYIIVWSYASSDVEGFEEWYEDHFDGQVSDPEYIAYMEEYVGDINTPYMLQDPDKMYRDKTNDWDIHMWYEFTRRCAFARAARTRYDELIEMGVPEEEIVFVRVDCEDDFIEKWNSWTDFESVQGVEFFTHGFSGEPSLYLGSSSPFFERRLPKLNWEKTQNCRYPYMDFHGCNTVVPPQSTGVSISQGIADYYGVRVSGNVLTSSFSTDKYEYEKISEWCSIFEDDIDVPIYLGTYGRYSDGSFWLNDDTHMKYIQNVFGIDWFGGRPLIAKTTYYPKCEFE